MTSVTATKNRKMPMLTIGSPTVSISASLLDLQADVFSDGIESSVRERGVRHRDCKRRHELPEAEQ